MTRFVRAPLINVNDETAKLAAWNREEGERIRKGEVLATLETLKATFEVEAEDSGYLRPLVKVGTSVRVGEVIAAITETADEPVSPPAVEPPPTVRPPSDAATGARRVTKKAELLATRAGVSLDELRQVIPGEATVTEADVESYLASRRSSTAPRRTDRNADAVDSAYPATRQQRILIIGAGMGAVQVLDVLARVTHQRPVGLVDDTESLQGTTVLGVPVLGRTSDVHRLFRDGVFDACVVSVSTNIDFRRRMQQDLSGAGVPFANVVDPSVRVGLNAVLGTGNVILPACHIGACTIIGNGNFVSPYVDLEHHNELGSYCTFGPGVYTSGQVRIGDGVKFGTGICVEPHVTIGDESIIASGIVLTSNVPARSIVKSRSTYVVRTRD